ncbi:unnamed protein product [Cylicocyclus nassatus]|uniref:Uncharacterized protein n=1 Tax=Cylicocyclus nassatus TaxID=53992 RepID=A0AA36GH61_CYLNA|nr:unnamed protein product [Cylicocyclus nassatus]
MLQGSIFEFETNEDLLISPYPLEHVHAPGLRSFHSYSPGRYEMRWLAVLLMLSVVSARLHFPVIVQLFNTDEVLERMSRAVDEEDSPRHEKPRPLRFGR